MSSTPDDAAPDDSTGSELPDPAATIMGGGTVASQNGVSQSGVDEVRISTDEFSETGARMTPEGQEIAPLRAKYPTRGNGWMLAGVLLLLVAVMFLTADINVSTRNDALVDVQECGTFLKSQAPADPTWTGACDDARSQRAWMVGVPAALGLLSIGWGISLRKRRP